jgi:predicted PurR-regulated permease PerM
MFIALLLLMSFIFGFMTFSYMLALATGAMLALLCYPVLQKLKSFGATSRAAAALLTIGIILLAVIPIFIFLSLAIKQGIAVAGALADNENFSTDNLFDKINDWGIIEKFFSSPEAAKKQLLEWIKETGTVAVASIINIARYVPNTLLQLALIVISFFYFLVDGPRFISWIYQRMPLDADVRKKVAKTFSDTTVSVILATLAAAAVQAAIMLVAFFVLSLPAIFLATTATFILAWIPIVGSTPVWVAAALYLYSQGLVVKAVLMLIFGIITGVSDNLVRPLILQGRSNMHPLVSLVGIFGGIGIFGIIGVFIGPIVAAVLISLLQILPVIQQRAKTLPSGETR